MNSDLTELQKKVIDSMKDLALNSEAAPSVRMSALSNILRRGYTGEDVLVKAYEVSLQLETDEDRLWALSDILYNIDNISGVSDFSDGESYCQACTNCDKCESCCGKSGVDHSVAAPGESATETTVAPEDLDEEPVVEPKAKKASAEEGTAPDFEDLPPVSANPSAPTTHNIDVTAEEVPDLAGMEDSFASELSELNEIDLLDEQLLGSSKSSK